MANNVGVKITGLPGNEFEDFAQIPQNSELAAGLTGTALRAQLLGPLAQESAALLLLVAGGKAELADASLPDQRRVGGNDQDGALHRRQEALKRANILLAKEPRPKDETGPVEVAFEASPTCLIAEGSRIVASRRKRDAVFNAQAFGSGVEGRRVVSINGEKDNTHQCVW